MSATEEVQPKGGGAEGGGGEGGGGEGGGGDEGKGGGGEGEGGGGEGGGGKIECVEGDGGGNEGGEGRGNKGAAGGGVGEGGGTLFPATHAHRADMPAVVPKEPAMAYEQHELGPAPPHPVYSMPEQDGEEP